jgi:bifunctional DNA-binding transcriptional regulator/antitoxin component of YhaV-PrlF toxin-antitoxin module
MNYTLELQEDENGELFIVFPDELTEILAWKEGDILEWKIKTGSLLLSKINDSAGYEVIEE